MTTNLQRVCGSVYERVCEEILEGVTEVRNKGVRYKGVLQGAL